MLLCPTVVNLREFYASSLGECVRRDLGTAINRQLAKGSRRIETIGGIGFAMPFLRPSLSRCDHVMSLMLPHIGGMYWPADISNHSVVTHEDALPLQDNSIDQLIACHALEHCERVSEMLSEMYRVLKPGGHALCILPNRRGLWARHDGSPFGSGHPYHVSQFKHRAELAGFTVSLSNASSALFYSPSISRISLKAARTVEMTGRVLLPMMGGVLLVDIEKQLYASIMQPKKSALHIPLLTPTTAQVRSSNRQRDKW